jgi:hypothetical protein
MKKFLLSAINSYSWNQARARYNSGVWSNMEWKAFERVWHWVQFRYSSEIQEEFYQKYGAVKLYEKINKTRKAFGLKPI